MRPLEKKEHLKKMFKQKNAERIKNKKPIILAEKLDLTFEPSTFDWFRYINGGVQDNE